MAGRAVEIHWGRLWYRLTGRCWRYDPIDLGGKCDNCGRGRSAHWGK